MRTKGTYLIFAAMIGLAMTGLQSCFEPADSYWGPGRQAHEQLEYSLGPKHEVCDAYGNNCVVCDADNDYCRRVPGDYGYSYGTYSRWR